MFVPVSKLYAIVLKYNVQCSLFYNQGTGAFFFAEVILM
jgi:hypothetical protein